MSDFGGHVREVHDGPCYEPYGCNVCNLFICTICGGAEGSLATECPGTRISREQADQIHKGILDYRNGGWLTQ